MPAIALLTDFGSSEYVGVMKGVLLSAAPASPLIDLTHDIEPQNVREGAWVLLGAYKWFPKGTIFLCVVDPGVGTARRALAVRSRDYVFVGPDNGLMSAAVFENGFVEARAIEVPNRASNTFHGRDVFAPSAARIAAGESLSALGESVADIERLSFHLDGREGEVVRIDRFGNCITNLPHLSGRAAYTSRIEIGTIPRRLPFHRSYGDAPEGGLFLVENAYGTLEIACKNGSAWERIKTKSGSRITLA